MSIFSLQYSHTDSQFCLCYAYIGNFNVVEWSAPAVKNRPGPCGVIAFTRISDHHAVVFGGNYQNARSDDLFIFDLKHKVYTTTYIDIS